MEQNVRIDKEVHEAAALHCEKMGIKLGKFCSEAVREKLGKKELHIHLSDESIIQIKEAVSQAIKATYNTSN